MQSQFIMNDSILLLMSIIVQMKVMCIIYECTRGENNAHIMRVSVQVTELAGMRGICMKGQH